ETLKITILSYEENIMSFIIYQAGLLLSAAVFGFFLAFYYDIYNLILAFFKQTSLLRVIGDLIWWLTALFLLLIFWFRILPGEIRLSVLLWQALGFCFFRVFFHPDLQKKEKSIRAKLQKSKSQNHESDDHRQKTKKVFFKPIQLFSAKIFRFSQFFWHIKSQAEIKINKKRDFVRNKLAVFSKKNDDDQPPFEDLS
ncbi:MAG: spore cortex biosynthesis protein YabQ, partial [Clostridiales bacterium]